MRGRDPFLLGMVKSYVTPFKDWKGDLQLGENIATFWNYLVDFFLREGPTESEGNSISRETS